MAINQTRGRAARRAALFGLSSALALAAGAAAAQSAPTADGATRVETIIVTARKTEESIQSIPLTVNALSAQQIAERGVSDVTRIAAEAPGLTFDIGLIPNDTRVAIRGIQAIRGRPNVAILVDGIDTTSETIGVAGGGGLVSLRFLDPERIEVVKGPQSVLYGRSAFAGAINYISRRPSRTGTEGDVSAKVGSFGEYELKANVSGPVSDVLAFGLTLGYWEKEGEYSNQVTGGKLGGGESAGGAFSALFTPNESFSAYLRFQASHEEYAQSARAFVSSVNQQTGRVNPADLGVLRPDPSPRAGSNFAPFGFSIQGDLSQAQTVRDKRITLSRDPYTGGDFPGFEIDAKRGSLELNWKTGFGTLTSLTGVTSATTDLREDFDHSDFRIPTAPLAAYAPLVGPYTSFYRAFSLPVPVGGIPAYSLSAMVDETFKIEQQSQELRWQHEVGRWGFTLDALFFHEQVVQNNRAQFWMREGQDPNLALIIAVGRGGGGTPTGGFKAQPFAPTIPTPYPQRISRDTESASIAGSISFQPTDKLTLRLDGRYITETIDYQGNPFDPFVRRTLGFPIPFVPPGSPAALAAALSSLTQTVTNTVEDDAFTPNVSIAYQLTPNNLVFFNYAEGFKPGGVDTTDSNGDIRDGAFKPEKLSTFEIGTKNVLLDGRMVVNLSIFDNIYEDQQVGYVQSVGGIPISITENIGESESRGAELGVEWQVTDGLRLSANYAYTDAEFTDYVTGRPGFVERIETGTATGIFTGKKTPLTPEHNFLGSARYEGRIGDDWRWYGDLSAHFVSERFISQTNLSFLPEYWEADLRVGLSNARWTVDAAIMNLFDDDTPKNAISTVDYGFFDLGSNNLPRAYLVTLAPSRSFSLRVARQF
jgi:iron complex outermembrane recepter protein